MRLDLLLKCWPVVAFNGVRKRPALTRSVYVVVLLFFIQFGFGRSRPLSSPARFQNDVAWIPFVPAGEDFSAMIPGTPDLLIQPTDYLQTLRDDAFIKVAKDYSESVQPLLKVKQNFLVERTGDGSTSKPEKKKGKILGIFPKP